MSCTINIKNISYQIGEKQIFKNVNLDVNHEEKVAIIGSNGSGKSSLLKILAGLNNPKSGEIFLFHEQISSLKEFRKYRLDIGYLPQDVNDFFLCPTVVEDVMFNLRAKEVNKEIAYEKAIEILTELEILHLKDRNIYDLSGGEQKIVALAAILITKPKILLLDEPTNALDEEAEKRIIKILNSIKKSMVIVSHHKSFIQSLTSTIYKLNKQGLEKIFS